MRISGHFILAAVVLMTAIPACSGGSTDDDIRKEQSAPDLTARPQRLVRMTGCTQWTSGEFSELLQFMSNNYLNGGYGASPEYETTAGAIAIAHFGDNVPTLAAKFLAEGSIGFHFERQNFLYRSVTAAGDSATFSGSVIYPCSNSGRPHTLDGWTIYSDFSNTCDVERVSEFPVFPYFRAAFNEAVALGDTQGFGATNVRNDHATTPLLPCYFDPYSKGRQTVDATIAASQVLELKGLAMAQDRYVENMGVSMGASDALGVLRYIQSEKDCPVWVRDSLLRGIRTFAGQGPLNMWESSLSLLEGDGTMSRFVFPMMIVTSAFASFPDQFRDYTIYDFFDPRVRNVMVPTDMGDTLCVLDAVAGAHYRYWFQYGYDELVSVFGTSLRNIMHSSLFAEDGTPNLNDPKMKLLKMAMDRWALSDGWNPKSPVLMVYGSEDELVGGLDGIRKYITVSSRQMKTSVSLRYQVTTPHPPL